MDYFNLIKLTRSFVVMFFCVSSLLSTFGCVAVWHEKYYVAEHPEGLKDGDIVTRLSLASSIKETHIPCIYWKRVAEGPFKFQAELVTANDRYKYFIIEEIIFSSENFKKSYTPKKNMAYFNPISNGNNAKTFDRDDRYSAFFIDERMIDLPFTEKMSINCCVSIVVGPPDAKLIINERFISQIKEGKKSIISAYGDI